ncbi:MAG TPA: DUF4398 domain-containing protein [Vicinamibacterales bacterium]|jgi:hypothetical protein|nr:DUF4398 domain-containing protein [Vicinamibacterales bacterium]
MRRLAAVLTALILCGACSEPPQKEIDRAQGAIDAARAAGAERYAAEEFTAATTALQQAHDAVTQRDYRTALSRALTASERAQEAARQAADEKARARAQAEVAITAAGNALQQLRTALKAAEAGKVTAKQLAPARKTAERIDRTLQEARTHVANERYPDATASVKNVIPEAGEHIRALSELSNRSRTIRRRR